jgi:predicted methyltransferase
MQPLQQVAATKKLRPAALQLLAELTAVRDDVARTSSKEAADRHSDRIEAILQLKADTEVILIVYYYIGSSVSQ